MDQKEASSVPSSPSPRRTDSPPSHLRRERDGRRPPYQPFRRISLTSVPSSSTNFLSHRASVVSAGSIESLPEDEAATYFSPPSSDMHGSTPSLHAAPHSLRTSSRLSDRPELQRRPSSTGSLSSIELNQRTKKQSSLRQNRAARDKSRLKLPPRNSDDILEAKKQKVMVELWETECAYVAGLDLIYSVRLSVSRPDL